MSRSHKVFVRNLAFQTRSVDLRAYFSQFGTVTDAVISCENRFRHGQRVSKGYGFVYFREEEAARRVMEIQEHLLDDRLVYCHTVTRKESDPLSAEEQVLAYIGLR
jgi:RNA recognition motif-containing protein